MPRVSHRRQVISETNYTVWAQMIVETGRCSTEFLGAIECPKPMLIDAPAEKVAVQPLCA